MKSVKKFSLRNVSDKLSDSELKCVIGGYVGSCNPSYYTSCSGDCTIATSIGDLRGQCHLVNYNGVVLCTCVES